MNQIRPKYVQSSLDLFCPVLNFVIDVGSSAKLVADMHIHARLGSGEDPVKLLLQGRFYTQVSWIKQIVAELTKSSETLLDPVFSGENCPKLLSPNQATEGSQLHSKL